MGPLDTLPVLDSKIEPDASRFDSSFVPEFKSLWTARAARRVSNPSMKSRSAALIAPVLLHLSANAAFAREEEADAIRMLLVNINSAPRGVELVAEGSIARASFLASGWACRQRILPDGVRQIIGFVLPGDALAPMFAPEENASCSILALTDVHVVNAAPLQSMLKQAEREQYKGLLQACALIERAEHRRMIEQIISLGRRSAYERLCFLFADLFQRLKVVGLTDGRSFPMPLTQEALADALGLSTVHANRTLQRMRSDGVVAVRRGWVTLLHDGAFG